MFHHDRIQVVPSWPEPFLRDDVAPPGMRAEAARATHLLQHLQFHC